MLKKLVLTVIVLVAVGAAVAYFVRNLLVEKAVEAGSAYALGVDTELGSAALELGGGSLELNDFAVDNPEGFAEGRFLSLRRMMFDVDAGSVLDKNVVVDSFIIEGVTLNLEQIDRSGNDRVLLDNINRLDLTSSEDSRTFRIALIALRDITVNGSLSLLGAHSEKSFTLDDFSLRNIGGDNGATVGRLTATIVKSLITKALAAGSGVLPEGFGKNLEELKDQGVETIKTEAADRLKDLGKSLTGDRK